MAHQVTQACLDACNACADIHPRGTFVDEGLRELAGERRKRLAEAIDVAAIHEGRPTVAPLAAFAPAGHRRAA